MTDHDRRLACLLTIRVKIIYIDDDCAMNAGASGKGCQQVVPIHRGWHSCRQGREGCVLRSCFRGLGKVQWRGPSSQGLLQVPHHPRLHRHAHPLPPDRHDRGIWGAAPRVAPDLHVSDGGEVC